MGLGPRHRAARRHPTPGTRMDLLVAPLRDQDGTLRGTLSIDLPADGRRPGPDQRRVLDDVRRAGRRAPYSRPWSGRSSPRRCGSPTPPDGSCGRRPASAPSSTSWRPRDLRSSRASGRWACGSRPSTRGRPRQGQRLLRGRDDRRPPRRAGVDRGGAARDLWTDQQVTVVAEGRSFGLLTEQQGQQIIDFLASIGVELDPLRPARRRPRVPRQPGADPPGARARLDRDRGGRRPRRRPRPRRRHPQRARLRARAPAWSSSCRSSTPTAAS